MDMQGMESGLAQSGENWAGRARELQTLLDELRPQLIDAETQLADRLAAISAFEFQVRARLESLNRRLVTLQSEIDELRRALRGYRDNSLEWDDGLPRHEKTGETWHRDRWRFDERAADSGAYRYRGKSEAQRPALEGERLASLKQLYRRLARRFHPDLALDEIDRAYRTDLMMAINAAYAAGDLAKLEQLAREPDSISRAPQTPEELTAALEHEIDRCRRRLAEITKELSTLEGHDSARLMKRAERAAAGGRDLLADLATDMRRRISEKMVERDVLETQLEEVEREGVELSAEDLADIVYNLGLEQADEGNLLGSDSGWRRKHLRPWETNDDKDEDDIQDDGY